MSIRAQFAGALIILAASLGGAAAQDSYPNRPIMVISPWTAGGVGEISARLIGEPMGKTLGQPLVIDSRAGGASKIGTEAVVRAPKDGHTLLFQNVVHSILPIVAAPLTYDPIGDFAPIIQTTSYPLMLVAHPSVPANTLPELITYLKNNPGKVSYSSGGPGSAMQFAGEMLKIMAGVDMLHVPYRGMSAAVNDTIAGHVQLSFELLLQGGDRRRPAQGDRDHRAHARPAFPGCSGDSRILPRLSPHRVAGLLRTGGRAARHRHETERGRERGARRCERPGQIQRHGIDRDRRYAGGIRHAHPRRYRHVQARRD